MAVSMVPRSLPWAQQPQIPVGIDWSNGITSSLVSVVHAGMFGATDPADGAGYSGKNSGISPMSNGVGLLFNGSSDQATRAITQPGAYTTLCIARTDTATASDVRNIMSAGSGTAYAWQIRQDSAQLSFYHESSSALLCAEAGVMTAGAEHIIVGTWDGLSTTRLYRAGIQRAQNTSATSIRATNSLAVGKENGNLQYFQGAIALVATWYRELSPQEVFNVSANPWQLFSPLIRRIWAPAASGLPTLSASTYTPGSITTNGFRPRVTAT